METFEKSMNTQTLKLNFVQMKIITIDVYNEHGEKIPGISVKFSISK